MSIDDPVAARWGRPEYGASDAGKLCVRSDCIHATSEVRWRARLKPAAQVI